MEFPALAVVALLAGVAGLLAVMLAILLTQTRARLEAHNARWQP